jgi:phosphate acyltransferase
LRIALDAMGGDHAPGQTVAGALRAAEHGFQILLVGDEAVLREELPHGLPPNVHVHHASQVVEMDDAPRSALRGKKKDSSLRLSFELVRSGQADAVVTMGNSGAALAMGMFVSGRLEGVLRPAIAALVPHRELPVVLLDVGANVECRPEHLHQFGVMGAALSRAAFGLWRPTVAVLSNGEEDDKGTELTRATGALLRDDPSLAFVGNVEPGDLLTGSVQVVVTDGWTGNIALKTAEGVLSHTVGLVREAARSSLLGRAGAAMFRPALRRALAHLDYTEYGGGLLLGIDACAVIGHGRSDATAVANALRFADRLARERLLDRIREGLDVGLVRNGGG